jgi:predicted enzyme related to lactoylglutathione lyase
MQDPSNKAAGTRRPGVPVGTELVRPFLPSRDFELSKKFYETLGFQKLLDRSDVAIFSAGSGGFLLQRRYQKDWAENCMMQLMVDDLDAWWKHITSLDLPTRFKVQQPKEPAVQPWGLRVAYLIDPSGVLWHVAQRRAGVVHD